MVTADNLKKADVAIEFTGHESETNNLIKSCNAGVAVV